MTTIIPVPHAPIGYVEIDGKQYPAMVPREWYRFFGLIQQATGGSTDIIGDISATEDHSLMAVVYDLMARVDSLESQLAKVQEFPFRRIDDLEMLIPGSSHE